MLLAFEGIKYPIALIECGELAGSIAAVLRGWEVREVSAPEAPQPLLTIRKTQTGYHCKSAPAPEPTVVRDDAEAVGVLVRHLIHSFAEDNSSFLCLHGLGVEFEQGLVIILSTDRLIKSTVAVHVVAAGACLFADDLLLLGPANNAFSSGILPRLRLSELEHQDERFRRFVRRRMNLGGQDHGFVSLSEKELAPFGTTAPICGVVSLQHGPATRSELMPAREAEALKTMIPMNDDPHTSALERLDRLHAVVDGQRCFNLRYTTGEEAVRLLQDEFGPAPDETAVSRGPPWSDEPLLGSKRLYSESRALVIGNAEYTGGWRWLRTPVRDAERVAEELRHRGFSVTLRRNLTGEATRSELRKFFTQQGANPRARLFLWFAGHGHKDEDDGYLVPADSPPPMLDDFAATALAMRELGDLVRSAGAKHVLCVVDSCTMGMKLDPPSGSAPHGFTDEVHRPARQFILSGEAENYVSDDGRFCTMFLRAIRGEELVGTDSDGYVTGSQLGAFLADRLPKLTDGAQVPRFGHLAGNTGNGGNFVFAVPHVEKARV